MEQHPIPRQITTFEFKLIGFLTLRQFIYLVLFIPLGFIAWKLFPLPLVNILIGVMVAALGVALAFLPINDRPLDVWLKNFYRHLNQPTQFFYHKNEETLAILQNLYFVSDPHKILAHIESRDKLSAYLAAQRAESLEERKKQQIQTLLNKKNMAQTVKTVHSPSLPSSAKLSASPTISVTPSVANEPVKPVVNSVPVSSPPMQSKDTFSVTTKAATPIVTPTVPSASLAPTAKKPFLIGIIRNNRKIPLPGIMVYIKDQKNVSLRLLKTNPHGVFATYNAVPAGEYTLELKDPNGGYFFDTMKVKIESDNPKPLELHSKEML